jgi:hypothetical protein
LPLLNSHFEKNIDTLLIDTLLHFDKSNHNLYKTNKNNTLEDAQSTFKVLEKNLILFHKLNYNIKNIIYSLLINYNEYNDFFIFYNKLTNNKLTLLTQEEIINKISDFFLEK